MQLPDSATCRQTPHKLDLLDVWMRRCRFPTFNTPRKQVQDAEREEVGMRNTGQIPDCPKASDRVAEPIYPQFKDRYTTIGRIGTRE
jgi:hypothetical protein